jgi:thioredoxin reductase
MPKGMFLKSTFDASSLSAPEPGWSLGDFWAEAGLPALDENPVPLDSFINYGLDFQRRRVKHVEPLEVRRIAAAPGGFRVTLTNGEEVSARAVVVASGHVCFAHIPNQLNNTANKPASVASAISHASQHSDFSKLSGRVVAVIGAGQSALESAVLLKEAGADVHLLVRGRYILWGNPPSKIRDHLLRRAFKPPSPLGPGWSLFVLSRAPELVSCLPAPVRLFLLRNILGPSGGWWLRSRFERNINVMLETLVEEARISNGRVALQLRTSSGERFKLNVECVIAATGYRVDTDLIQFLDPALKARIARVKGTAAPCLSHSFESSIPGLYFTGLSAAATFGPVLRFVCGCEFTARRISRALTGSRSSAVGT